MFDDATQELEKLEEEIRSNWEQPLDWYVGWFYCWLNLNMYKYNYTYGDFNRVLHIYYME
jgi:hypothetical protein